MSLESPWRRSQTEACLLHEVSFLKKGRKDISLERDQGSHEVSSIIVACLNFCLSSGSGATALIGPRDINSIQSHWIAMRVFDVSCMALDILHERAASQTRASLWFKRANME